MPPSGSVTPMSRIEPQPATTIAEQIQAPTRQEASLKRRSGPPRFLSESDNMNRATRVPASTVVRMNNASNMIAKWYQKALKPLPPNTSDMTCDIPMARVGAPPVRETMEVSPMSRAVWVSWSPVIFGPLSGRPLT